jgi:hypothetical protein
MYGNKKGYVIGQTGDGDLIIQIQGSTEKVNPSKVKSLNPNKPSVKPTYKFDKVTQKVLFEQYVQCGIYMNNTPIKTSNCYVKYSDWQNAKDGDNVKVLIEGLNSVMDKRNVRIFEDINDFGNPDNFTEGVIIDENTNEAIENILINIADFTNSNGDADMVRIVKNQNGEQFISSAPAAILRTLSV